MNKYRSLDPEQVAKASGNVTLVQYRAAKSALLLIRDTRESDISDWAWTAAAAYRAGRLCMWREGMNDGQKG